jgi:DNA polymerase III subunit epsilon
MPEIKSFTAIDFETARGDRNSICQVGLVRVEKGEITKRINLLVQPPQNYYWRSFIDIHGITPQKTFNAPTFDKIWFEIEPFIKKQHVVAHNISFDSGVLKHTLEYYGLKEPEYIKHCTCNIYFRRNLSDLCREFRIALNHHDALSDAMACAELFLMHLRNLKEAERSYEL